MNLLPVFISMIALIIGTNSCSLKKEQICFSMDTLTEVQQSTNNERLTGTVELTDECGIVVRVVQGDLERSYMVQGLKKRFKKNGLKIQFNYTLSVKKSSKECSSYIPIIVSNVKRTH
jgi:hypothetical protein